MDAGGQTVPGSIWSTVSGVNFINLRLHGWSPDGRWLLYSIWTSRAEDATLYKVKVNTDGSLDAASIAALVANQPISGATWRNLTAPATPPAPVLTIAPSGRNTDFKWTATPSAEGYYLYYALHPTAATVNRADAGNLTEFSLTLPAGVGFYIAIQPYNAAGDAFGFSNIALLRQ